MWGIVGDALSRRTALQSVSGPPTQIRSSIPIRSNLDTKEQETAMNKSATSHPTTEPLPSDKPGAPRRLTIEELGDVVGGDDKPIANCCTKGGAPSPGCNCVGPAARD